MWHLKNTNVAAIVVSLRMIKIETDEYINKISGCPSLYKIQKIHFAKLFIPLRDHYQCVW